MGVIVTKKNTPMEYQKAIDYILEKIYDGKLVIGSKIPSERDVAEEIGIGRNSTREALSILRGLGLVESVHGSGNYIAGDCGESIRTIISVMLALGSVSKKDVVDFRRAISRSICLYHMERGISKEVEKEAITILTEMETADQEAFSLYDQQFHLLLIESTENPLYITIMKPIAQVYYHQVQQVAQQTDDAARKSLAQIHRKWFESLLQKDETTCMKYLNEHYTFVEDMLL